MPLVRLCVLIGVLVFALVVLAGCAAIPEGAVNPYCIRDCVSSEGDNATVSSTVQGGA